MEDHVCYNIEPHYSSHTEIGRCVRCQAENDMNNCLMSMLNDESGDSAEDERKFNALLKFLKSPESDLLVEESERLMSEGKKVSVNLYIEGDEAKYELVVED